MFGLYAEMYNNLTPGEVKANKLEENKKQLEERVTELEKRVKWILENMEVKK